MYDNNFRALAEDAARPVGVARLQQRGFVRAKICQLSQLSIVPLSILPCFWSSSELLLLILLLFSYSFLSAILFVYSPPLLPLLRYYYIYIAPNLLFLLHLFFEKKKLQFSFAPLHARTNSYNCFFFRKLLQLRSSVLFLIEHTRTHAKF